MFFRASKNPKKKNTTNGSSPIPIFQTSSRKDQFSEFQAPRPILCIQHPAYSLVDKSKNLTRHRTPGRHKKTTQKNMFASGIFVALKKVWPGKKVCCFISSIWKMFAWFRLFYWDGYICESQIYSNLTSSCGTISRFGKKTPTFYQINSLFAPG